ncbi:protein HIDE1 isoform X2 [Mus musculus]|uniref:protein HIDE1 isoform X2 n=1 Tax=Mus musculus TaxID=10090 RepID=UPI0005ABA091|nr:protein HIDE1 isoform X2 [Mus musculus]|eukprot:XP_011240869.1 PREDICTED: protein HIDE1 isoform X1 [Mus musculus]
MGGEMPWTILLFASGSLAIPAPSISLVPPYPSSHEDPIYISCTAPGDILGANFTLFRGGEVVQLLQAPSDRPDVTFNVTGGGSGGGGEAAGGNFCCQYGVMGEHSQPQLSDFSQQVQVSFPAKAKNLQKQRERESCWAQINFTNTDMSFDNSLFAISTLTMLLRVLLNTCLILQPEASRSHLPSAGIIGVHHYMQFMWC